MLRLLLKLRNGDMMMFMYLDLQAMFTALFLDFLSPVL